MSDLENQGIANLVEAQRELNKRTALYLEYRRHYRYLPLTRWEKTNRRIASRWSRIRCRVALWIAPELDDY